MAVNWPDWLYISAWIFPELWIYPDETEPKRGELAPRRYEFRTIRNIGGYDTATGAYVPLRDVRGAVWR